MDNLPVPLLYLNVDNPNSLSKRNYSEVHLGPKSVDIDYVAPYVKKVDENSKVKNSAISYQ